MSAYKWPAPLVRYALGLDSAGQARLRRGSVTTVLLLPGLARLLHDRYGSDLDEALLLLRITAILGRNGPQHPANALAAAKLDVKRMGRLLASDAGVMPGRLITVARFLAAKPDAGAVDSAKFYWLTQECGSGRKHSNRAEWARFFAEKAQALKTGTSSKAAS